MAPTRRTARTARASRTPSARRPQAITNLQDANRPKFYKWWVHGDTGVGKTVLAGTAPKALFLTSDVEGTASAEAFGSTADELRVASWEGFVDAVGWIVHPQGGQNEFDWIIVDTADEVEELCWLSQLVSTDVRRASKYQPNKADYPIVWAKLKDELMRLNRAPVNVLYLSHSMRVDRESDDGEETLTLAMPSVGSRKRGDLSTALCAQMTLVGYMRKVANEDGKPVRQLATESSLRWIAKDRHHAFGAGIINPTIPGMLETISSRGEQPTRRPRRARTK